MKYKAYTFGNPLSSLLMVRGTSTQLKGPQHLCESLLRFISYALVLSTFKATEPVNCSHPELRQGALYQLNGCRTHLESSMDYYLGSLRSYSDTRELIDQLTRFYEMCVEIQKCEDDKESVMKEERAQCFLYEMLERLTITCAALRVRPNLELSSVWVNVETEGEGF